MLDRLEARAQAALRHADLRLVIAAMPANLRNDAAALRVWLSDAAQVAGELGHPLARSGAVDDALEALAPVERARGLRDEVSRLYHDPRLRAEAAAAGLDFEHLADHPDEAYQVLVARGRLSAEADQALSVIAEVRQFAVGTGATLPAAAEPALPSSADGVDAEYRSLIEKSATGRLSPSEDQRLNRLAELRTGDQERAQAAAEAASSTKPGPDE
jgi:hypothetical protein